MYTDYRISTGSLGKNIYYVLYSNGNVLVRGSGHEDFYAYYAQRCEENSRNYSEDAVCDYYKNIFGSEYHGYELDIDFLAERSQLMKIIV